MEKIKESDWEAVEGIRRTALERLCRRALEEARNVASDSSQSWYQRFQDTTAVLDGRERQVRLLVGDLHRSNAYVRLAAMKASDLISADEFSGLSEETRAEIDNLIEILYTPANGKTLRTQSSSGMPMARGQQGGDSEPALRGEPAEADPAGS